jgi:hypothetical protein
VRALAILLLLGGTAFAQMEGAGMPPMDPAQMSGIPRPDGQVPAGTLTVKLLQGELAKWARPGTPVHLVGLRADGTATHARAAVGEDGRVEFAGLARDGSVAYYALALLGEDRLLAQPAILPPEVGVRMALVGRKLDAPPPPRDDEQRSPGADPHAAHAGGVTLPTAGEVEIQARGRVEIGGKVTLRSYPDGETREAVLEGEETMPSARFTGVPGGADRVWIAEIAAGGRRYLSTPFQLTPAAGARRMVLVYDRLLFAMQGGAQPEDDGLWFQLQITVANVGSAPVPTGPEGLVLPLPAGFRSGRIAEEDSGFALLSGVGLVARGPVAPGQLGATVSFKLPVEDGRASFAMPAPLGMFQSHVAILKTEGMVVAPEGGGAPRAARADDGREYLILEGFNVAPGEALRFTVAGLPQPQSWQAWARIVAAILVVALVAATVAVAIRRPRARSARPADAAVARRELGQRREKLFAELVALERLRAQERIDAGDFDAQRRAIMTKLVLVHRELDELDGGSATA